MCAVLALPALALAQSDDGGAYFQAHLGAAFATQSDFPTASGGQRKFDLETGGSFGLIGGYRAASGFGVDVELGSRSHDFDQFAGEFSVSYLMVNGLYELMDSERWRPYLAAGVGIAGSEDFDYDDTGLAGQLKAGLRYKFGETQSIGVEGAYLYAPELGEGGFDLDYAAFSTSIAYRIGLGR